MSKDRKRWLPEEDKIILDEVSKIPSGQRIIWQRIADKVGGVSGRQCSERYHGVIDPTLKHGKLTPEEIKYIETNYGFLTNVEMSNYLHRAQHQIRNYIRGHISKIKSDAVVNRNIDVFPKVTIDEFMEKEEAKEKEKILFNQIINETINHNNDVFSKVTIDEFMEDEAAERNDEEGENEMRSLNQSINDTVNLDDIINVLFRELNAEKEPRI